MMGRDTLAARFGPEGLAMETRRRRSVRRNCYRKETSWKSYRKPSCSVGGQLTTSHDSASTGTAMRVRGFPAAAGRPAPGRDVLVGPDLQLKIT